MLTIRTRTPILGQHGTVSQLKATMLSLPLPAPQPSSLAPQPSSLADDDLWVAYFEAGSSYVAQAGLEFSVLLLLPPSVEVAGMCHCAWLEDFLCYQCLTVYN